MKLAHMMATHDASVDTDDNDDSLEPSGPVVARVPEEVEPDPLIVDEFDPTLSFRDAKERAMMRWARWYVAQLLRYTRGNLSEAARLAHSDRGHLRKLARKHLHWESRSPHAD